MRCTQADTLSRHLPTAWRGELECIPSIPDDPVTLLMQQSVMMTTQQHQIIQLRLTTVAPMLHMMSIDIARLAAQTSGCSRREWEM